MTKAHKIQPVTLCLILIGWVLTACQAESGLAQQATTPTPIPTAIIPEKPTYTVQRGEVVRTLEFTARVSPRQQGDLFFRADGFVRAIFAESGDEVTAGEILAELEIAELERSLETAQQQLEAAEQAWTQAKVDHQLELSKGRIALETAQTKLKHAAVDYSQEQVTAETDLAIKRLELDKAETEDPLAELDKAAAAYQKTVIDLQEAQAAYDLISWRNDIGSSSAAAELQKATLDKQQAEAEFKLAQQAIEAKDFDMAILKQEIVQLEQKLNTLQGSPIDPELTEAVALAELELEALTHGVDPKFEQDVAAAELEVKQLEAQVNEARIIAPFAGTITSLLLTPGRSVDAFDSVGVIANADALEVSVTLTSDQMSELSQGQTVALTPVDYPGQTLSGTIRQLPLAAVRDDGETLTDLDRSTRIELDFASLSPEIDLSIGDLLRATVVLERKTDVLWLPPAAVRTFSGRTFVLVQDEARQRRVDVTVGVEGEEQVEIESGLEEGQVVLGP